MPNNVAGSQRVSNLARLQATVRIDDCDEFRYLERGSEPYSVVAELQDVEKEMTDDCACLAATELKLENDDARDERSSDSKVGLRLGFSLSGLALISDFNKWTSAWTSDSSSASSASSSSLI